MRKEDIEAAIWNHQKWLKGDGGACANFARQSLRGEKFVGCDLRKANFKGAKLQNADFTYAKLDGADFRCVMAYGAKFKNASLNFASMKEADLVNVDFAMASLVMTDFSEANLKDASFDFSAFPLWCGSLSAKLDDAQIKQLIYHVVKAGLHSENVSDKLKENLKKWIDVANLAHCVGEGGKIRKDE